MRASGRQSSGMCSLRLSGPLAVQAACQVMSCPASRLLGGADFWSVDFLPGWLAEDPGMVAVPSGMGKGWLARLQEAPSC